MPISKQKLKELAQSVDGGVLSNGLTDSAASMINKIVEKVHAKLFPKNSSVELPQVQARIRELFGNNQIPPCAAPYAIPLITIKKMVREYAGDVKVPDNTLTYLCGFLQGLLVNFMSKAAGEIKDGLAILDAKHIKSSMEQGHDNAGVKAIVAGASKKRRSSSKKRRSSSKKRRSSSKKRRSSKKKCSRGKSPVSGFSRMGVKVKTYCRKKSSSR
jgi:hypothetical protein